MGIKNFQGNHVGKEAAEAEKITVRDFMTEDITTFKKGQPILEVMEALVKLGISGGPVVDEDGKLIGIISEGDCIKQISESRYYNQPMEATNVEDYMIKNVETVDPDMHLFDLAN
ncbi:MAG: CBS domain-containing protein, partial [Mesonia sp.]